MATRQSKANAPAPIENAAPELENATPTEAENTAPVAPAPEVTAPTAAPEAPPTAKAAASVSEGRRFVYAGPSLPGGALKSNTILRGTRAEIEAYLAEPLEEYPLAAKLIVPVAALAATKTKLGKPDNVVKKYFDDLSTAITKRSKEE
jgi:hypothetical protein